MGEFLISKHNSYNGQVLHSAQTSIIHDSFSLTPSVEFVLDRDSHICQMMCNTVSIPLRIVRSCWCYNRLNSSEKGDKSVTTEAPTGRLTRNRCHSIAWPRNMHNVVFIVKTQRELHTSYFIFIFLICISRNYSTYTYVAANE